MCRICNEKDLVSAYEIETGICVECQKEIAQAETKLLLQRKFFGGKEWSLSKVRNYLVGKKDASLN